MRGSHNLKLGGGQPTKVPKVKLMTLHSAKGLEFHTVFIAGKAATPGRCRANMAHVRQSRPYCGLGFQVKALDTLQVVPSSLGS